MYRKLLYLARLLVVGIVISTITTIFGVSLVPFQVDPAKAATADPQSVSTDEDISIDITLTGSDSGVCELTFTITVDPSNGSLGGITDQGCSSATPNIDSAIVTYTPASDFNGGDSFEFQVDNGTETSAAIISITIDSVNDAPTISDIPDQTTPEDTSTGPIGFTVGDTETPAGSLAVSGTSSNQTLVPDA
ncbi:MAG TPA: Ig-like domain-containing protein, partial [Anaerolineales bacterium]|nr:Ig-like domain-containing protein [Anaerolineales bacterium]